MSVDHILQHDLVQENPLAADFVSTMEREMQNIKERFNKNDVDSRIKEWPRQWIVLSIIQE